MLIATARRENNSFRLQYSVAGTFFLETNINKRIRKGFKIKKTLRSFDIQLDVSFQAKFAPDGKATMYGGK